MDKNIFKRVFAKRTTLLFLILPFFLVSLASASSCGTLPSGLSVSSCIPISIQNSQSSALTANTQVMLTFNALNYSSYLASNLQNIVLYNTSSGKTAPAWIEGNMSNENNANSLNKATNVIIWLKLPDALGASTTDTNWAIGVGSTSTNYYTTSGANIGIAPQLTSTYGEYDNGKQVFNNYWNFSGTSLPFGWSSSSGSYTQDNGITLTTTFAPSTWPLWYNKTLSYPFIVDSYMEQKTAPSSTQAWGQLLATSSSGTNSIISFTGVGTTYTGTQFQYSSNGNAIGTSSLNTSYIFSIDTISTESYFNENYSQIGTQAVNYPYIAIYTSVGSIRIHWIRTRSYPPNGVQPTFTSGKIVLVGTSLSITPNPALYNQSITINAICYSSTDSCSIDYPSLGTAIATGIGSATYTYSAYQLSAGTYSKFYAVDNTESTNSTGQTLTVQKISSILTFVKECSSLSCMTVANITTHNNQVKGYLYLNNNFIANTTLYIKNKNTTNYTINTIGKYTYTFNSLSTTNYTSNSISYSYINIVSVYVQNTTANPANTFPFSTSNGAPTISNRYPIKIYTTSPNSTIRFTLNQSYNGGTQTTEQSKVLNLSYVPISTQSSGNYIYYINETQNGNFITLQLNYTLNMTVLKCQPKINGTNVNFQYFPIPIGGLIRSCWYSIPSYYEINTFKNNTIPAANLVDTRGSNTLTLPNNMEAFYTMFKPTVAFNLTSVNNLSITSYSLQSSSINISISAVGTTTRHLINFSTYDGQFFTPLNALSDISFNYNFNNYSLFYSGVAHSNNTNNIWFTQSNFQNPNICLNNITFATSASGHTTSINSYLSLCQSDTQSRTFKIYLNNVNSSLVTFNIYKNGGGGYGGFGDYLYIYTGSSPQSLSLTQIYSIGQTVPFQIYLGTQQQYLFKVISSNNNQTLAKTSLQFVNYQTPVNIYLPYNNTVPIVPLINATATCSYAINSNNFTVATCNGTDLYNMINQWHVVISRITSYLNTSYPLQNYYNTNSSFIHQFNLTNNTWQYNIKIIGCENNYCVQLYNNNYGRTQSIPYGVFGVILGIFFLIMAITGGYETPETAIAVVILALFILNAIGIMNMPIEVWIGITIAGALVIWRVVTKTSRPTP